MRCDLCQGLGKLTYDELPAEQKAVVGLGSVFPCPRCGGSGIDHCCDGMVCNGLDDESAVAGAVVGQGAGDRDRRADPAAAPVRPGNPTEGMA